MKNPSIFGSSQKRGVLIPICSRFESVTFRESEAILTLPEVCQQSEPGFVPGFFLLRPSPQSCTTRRISCGMTSGLLCAKSRAIGFASRMER
ncbi:hypothetical protein B3286c1_0951 [Brucella vulpis]|uniref:hypothetical protein n=1 Tax=Brucella vulpis TaxID=981386 RepID=UPI00073AAFAA|nr:hypothetical protein BF3285c1_0952 [Brucella vulpis]CUW49780.1 hypothetical protein B3286c1_0951 [Brucella vulpis]